LTGPDDGSGDIFILEKGGTIRLVKNGKVQDQPFLDITSRVGSSGSEQGLLGLAFHPDYKNNGYLYVDYTNTDGNTVIARFTANSDHASADPNSFKQILTFKQPYANHNGGQITFGPDGMLWIGAGDGGSEGDPQGNGQKTDTFLGKILRIDVDHGDPYAIPPDNPFASGSGGKPEIWAYGLRNPWRFSFDSATHDLYIGDVGQNKWEEIDFVSSDLKPGLNFGWNRMEGTHCYSPPSGCDQSGLTMPVAEFSHAPGNCSVTGGYVYRGSQYAKIQGAYFFTDYCSGTVWALTHDASGNWTQTQVAQGGSGFSSFGEDANGELYVTDLSNGTVYHLTATSK
jgi:glucose/arabinose dehydrogenase